eukprot:m.260777 g.260777  ORF g.260777 m.260777 type:complete len:57 (-) comp22743_c0_seq3:121-291(-)
MRLRAADTSFIAQRKSVASGLRHRARAERDADARQCGPGKLSGELVPASADRMSGC